MTSDRIYIGDGVYLSHDGYYIWLTTDREDGIDQIGLEPDVFQSMLDCVSRIEEDNNSPGFWTGKQ